MKKKRSRRPPITLKQIDIDRFWAKVEKSADPNGCWIWTGSPSNRYGVFYARGRSIMAHRASWEIHYGPIPAGLFVCHKCDCGHCVRPDHLFLGTHADNMADMVKKGRSARHHACAKLSADKVRAIRRKANDYTRAELSQEYGVCINTIQNVISRRTWVHI